MYSRHPARRDAPAPEAPEPVRSALRASGGRALLGISLALVLVLGLELAHGLNKPWPEPWDRVLELEPGIVAIGVLVVWAVIAFLHAVTNRMWIAAGGVSAFVALMAFADYSKMRLRGEPLFVTDATYLTQISFLVENVGTGVTIAFGAVVVAIALVAWMCARPTTWRRRAAAPPSRTARRRHVVARVVAGTVAGTIILTAASFNQPGSAARQLYEAAGAKWAPWNQAQNYDDNGVIAGLLYNMPAAPMDVPAGYSKAAMAELAQRYSAVAEGLNATRDVTALQDTNIVLVLSESLSDPLAMPGITPAEDPLPFLRELMSRNTSGTLLSGGYGGGTANVEFEVLTGMAVANLRPQVDSPFHGLVARSGEFPSHLRSFGTPERSTYAIHPYFAEFYRRNAVYPALGIERMDFRDSLRDLAKMPGDRYASDAAVFGAVVEELRASEAPMLINAVTMQNHGPQEGLSDPISVDGPLTDRQSETAGQYLRGLRHSDDALRELTESLAELDERTIVLLYGDHLPSVWPERVLEASGPLGRYETPWVVFANFPTEVHQPGTVGGNQLVNQVLDAAAAPHTPWTALLHELAAEAPAMERTGWLSADGQQITEGDLSERGRELLRDYRMAQYDMVAGKGWATDSLLATPGG